MFNFRSLAELVGVNIDDGSAHQTEGEASPGHVQDATSRPLSQVKEEEKEGTEAEHVEKGDKAQAGTEQGEFPPGLSSESTAIETIGESGLSPKVTITPGTPMPEDDVPGSEAKQLVHPNLFVQPPSEVLH
jgi:hypothetical protein